MEKRNQLFKKNSPCNDFFSSTNSSFASSLPFWASRTVSNNIAVYLPIFVRWKGKREI